jgi:hypothetical protein
VTISNEATLTVKWVPTSRIRLDDQLIDAGKVDYYRELMADGGHLAPPILNPDYTVRDGRHRVLAHRYLGRTHVRVLIVTEKDPN